jgi:5-methylcytosine-specific restriction enzyme A
VNARQYRRLHNRQKGECTMCGEPVPKGSRTWCSQKCVDAFMMQHWPAHRRQAVHQRDRGVCQLCGTDTEMIRRIVQRLRHGKTQGGIAPFDAYRHAMEHYRNLGFSSHFHWWEADHIVPQVEGGGHELENLRTLCLPCHKAETAALAARRATRRRETNQPLLQMT